MCFMLLLENDSIVFCNILAWIVQSMLGHCKNIVLIYGKKITCDIRNLAGCLLIVRLY